MTTWSPATHGDVQTEVTSLRGGYGTAVYLAQYGPDATGASSSVSAFTSALSAATGTGGPGRLVLGKGTFNLTGLAISISSSVMIEGVPGQTILDFGITTPTDTSQNHFTGMNGVTFALRGITFQNAGKIIRPDNTALANEINISNCRFLNVGTALFYPSTDSNDGNGFGAKRLFFMHNTIDGTASGGVQFCPDVIGYAYVAGNEFLNCVRAGLLLGLGTAGAQASRGRYSIIGNRVKGVSGPTDAVGIQLFGQQAQVIGNSVENTASDDQTDCEAIYMKVMYGTIVGNTTIDAGSNQGALCIKGKTRSDVSLPLASRGIAITVADNVVKYTSAISRDVCGIWIQSDDAQISNNYIEGITDIGIGVENDQRDRIRIRDNLIYNNRGNVGINAKNYGSDLVITGNTIAGFTNDYAAATVEYGIQIATVAVTTPITLQRVRISGNKISGMSGATTYEAIRLVNSNASGVTLTDIAITDNQIDCPGTGISFVTTGVISDVYVAGNMIRGATTPIGNAAGVANLVQGVNSFSAGTVSPGAVNASSVLASNAVLATSSTTMAPLSLSVSVQPGTYLLFGLIDYDGPTAAGLAFGFTVPSGTTGSWTPGGITAAATSQNGAQNFNRRDFSQDVSIGAAGAGTRVAATPVGRLVVTTAGTVVLHAAQATSNAAAVTVYAGSFLTLQAV